MADNQAGGNNPNGNADNTYEKPEVERGLSPVASIPTQNLAIVVVVTIIIAVVMYNLFIADSEEQQQQEEEQVRIEESFEVETTRPADSFETVLPSIPSLPEPPPLIVPDSTEITVPPPLDPEQLEVEEKPDVTTKDVVKKVTEIVTPPPPKPVEIEEDETTSLDIAEDEDDLDDKDASVAKKEALDHNLDLPSVDPVARLQSNIMAFSNNAAGNAGADQDEGHNFVPSISTAERVRATKIGDMTATIAQGKIINAVLESAINSSLAGPVRAIISRDVYAEQGQSILIPKGSRVIGTYDANISYGQKRLNIVWDRVIRPDGLDIAISSPASDEIGRAGVGGTVNNKYVEMISNALLVSTVRILWTKISEEAFGSSTGTTTTTTSSDGTSSTASTNTATDDAISDASDNIADTFDQITSNASVDDQPVFMVDQGTQVKIFVNRDVIFPYSSANKAWLLQ